MWVPFRIPRCRWDWTRLLIFEGLLHCRLLCGRGFSLWLRCYENGRQVLERPRKLLVVALVRGHAQVSSPSNHRLERVTNFGAISFTVCPDAKKRRARNTQESP